MKKFLEQNFINVAIVVVGILILTGSGLTFYNKKVMKHSLDVKRQSDVVLKQAEDIYMNIRLMDISSRGYALVREESFLFYPVEDAIKRNKATFKSLDSLFSIQGYSDPENYQKVKEGLDNYVKVYSDMVQFLREDNMEGYLGLLKEDFGKKFYAEHLTFSQNLAAYENQLNQEADAQYQAAGFRNLIVQILLLIVGLPTLAFLMFKLKKQEATKNSLVLALDKNNRKFLFNPGKDQNDDAKEIMENSILNLQKASDFVTQISEGNYEVQWDQLNEGNAPLNEDNLIGKLLKMREQMKKVKEEDKRRLWVTEGLAQFTDIIRNHQDNLTELTDHCLIFLVKYLSAQQGAIFILEGTEQQDLHLNMISCYAFNRKKFLKKRVEIGEGVVGQIYLEGEATILTEIPQQYTYITSGLGNATPNCLLVIPMKYNDEVRAVVEIASFRQYAAYEIEFVEKAGEFVASAIAATQDHERTQQLLRQFKEQTEQMRSQEEELRQNMEELEATQEEMRRKEQELERRLSEAGGAPA